MGFAPAQGSGGEGPTHLMPEQTGDPTAVLDAGTVYTKDVAGETELFYEDSAGNDVQITDAGAVVGPAPGGSSADIQTNNGSGGFGAPGPEINASAQLLMGNGVVGAPSVAGSGDTDTGMTWALSGADSVSMVAGGVEVFRFTDAGSTPGQSFSAVPLVTNLGTAALPNIVMALSQNYGFYSRVSGSAFGTTLIGVQHGWEVGRIGGAQSYFAAKDEHQASPVTICSLCSWEDLDTGVSFGVDTIASTSLFAAGAECIRCAPDSEVMIHPALTNTTGYVFETGVTQTTDGSATTALTKTLADDTVYTIQALIVGRDTSGTDRASYIREAQAHREGGGSATLTSIQAAYTSETDAAWDATFTVSGNDLRVTVTGKAATTVNWSVSLRSIGSE